MKVIMKFGKPIFAKADQKLNKTALYWWGFALGGVSFLIGSVGSVSQLVSHSGIDSSLDGQASDTEIWTQAFALADLGQFAAARDLAAGAKDQALLPILSWTEYRSGQSQASADDIAVFIDNHGNFPGMRHVEISRQSILKNILSDEEMLSYYATHPPVNFPGQLHKLEVMQRVGNADQAADTARHYWRTRTLRPTDQDALLSAFGEHFTQSDHEARLKHLIIHGAKTSGQRLIEWLDEPLATVASAWVDGASPRESIDSGYRNHPVFVVPLVLKFDADGDVDAALGALESIPDSLRLPSFEWRARHIVARELLKQQRFDDAYRVAKNHGLRVAANQRDDTVAEANWLAGWIALTRLGLTFPAQQHFEFSRKAAASANWRAQSAFWLGTTHRSQQQGDRAEALFAECAAFLHTYYGQRCLTLSDVALFEEGLPIGTRNVGIEMFGDGQQQQLLESARALLDIGRTEDASKFLYQLSALARTPQDVAILSDLAISGNVARTSMGLSWLTAERKLFELSSLLPVLDVKLLSPVSVELSLLHAITSRESVFVKDTVSAKGALGLMQVLPSTGQLTAQKLGLVWDADRMIDDEDYNLTLGAAYLDQLITRFDGNILLAIASYNAGPGNIERWLADFGDPGMPDIDASVWVESIPFRETRNYVKDVIARYNLYRALLAKQPVSVFTAEYLSRI